MLLSSITLASVTETIDTLARTDTVARNALIGYVDSWYYLEGKKGSEEEIVRIKGHLLTNAKLYNVAL